MKGLLTNFLFPAKILLARYKKQISVYVSCFCLIILVSFGLIYVRAPITVALWFVETYPNYFAHNARNELQTEYSGPEQILIRGLAYKLLHDWGSNQAKPFLVNRHSSLERPYETISSLIRSIRNEVLNQNELPHSAVGEPSFSRLINGFSYCDGVNQLLAIPLAEIYGDNKMFATRYPTTGVSKSAAGKSTHVNVLVKLNGVEAFADAWSSIPLFKLRDSERDLADVPFYEDVHAKVPLAFNLPNLSTVTNVGTLIRSLKNGKIDGISAAGFESLLHASTGGMLRKSAYINGESRSLTKKRFLRYGQISLDQDLEPESFIEEHQNNLAKVYLVARVFHIYGEIEKAKMIYKYIDDTKCQMIFCNASRIFLGKSI